MLSAEHRRAWARAPIRTTSRIVASLIRKRHERWRYAVAPYDEGRSRIVCDLRTALGLTLFRFGVDDVDRDLVCKLLGPGDLFIDGGANVGLFTLAAASRVGATGAVVAFEPAKETRKRLEENLELNRFSWVEVRSEALAETAGTRTLTAFDGDSAGLSSFRPSSKGGGRQEQVETTTIDEVLVGRIPQVVKLDLEGAELAALQGAGSLISLKRTVFVLELEDSHLRRQRASASQVLELFEQNGYQMFKAVRAGDGRVAVLRGVGEPLGGRTPNVIAAAGEGPFKRAGVTVVQG